MYVRAILTKNVFRCVKNIITLYLVYYLLKINMYVCKENSKNIFISLFTNKKEYFCI